MSENSSPWTKERIHDATVELSNLVQRTYMNSISIRAVGDHRPLMPLLPHDHPLNVTRDSVVHRVGSVNFHLKWMYELIAIYDRDASKNPKKHLREHVVRNVSYILEDVFFNLGSTFDYIAGFASYIVTRDFSFIGKDWDEVLSTIKKGQRQEEQGQSDIGDFTRNLLRHKRFIKELLEQETIARRVLRYRAEVYHDLFDDGLESDAKWLVVYVAVPIVINPPPKMLSSFSSFINDKMIIQEACQAVIGASYQAIYQILSALNADCVELNTIPGLKIQEH